MKFFRWPAILLLALIMLIAAAWTYGALSFDGPGRVFAALYVAALIATFIFVKRWPRKLAVFAVWFAVVLGWWLTLKPTNDADWQPDVAELGWAEIDGDTVTIHNVRNCEYRSESDYTPRWETRVVRIPDITGIDIAIDYWGSPWIAHPIISFQIAGQRPLCFSIETRKKVGQSYSAIGGLYRQYELIFIPADERDVIRLRTNYREGEDIYLYRTTITPAGAQERFREYIRSLNSLHEKPRWYNALTTNCTTAIRHQHPSTERPPFDWRILLNGKGDEMLYERGMIITDDLPFAELKERVHINAAAKAANDDPDFSKRIREGRPGM